MYRIMFLILIFAIPYCSFGQYEGFTPSSNTASFSQQFASATQKIETMQSDFVQEKNLSMLSDKIVSKGKCWFKKSSLLRMEYMQPYQYLMIINNNNVYIKDAQKENKISAKSNKLFQQINKVMLDCVRGTVLQNTDFSFRLFENGSRYLVELTPISKTLQSYFNHINLVIDRKDFSPSEIRILEQGGDNTNIRFVNKTFNIPIADAVFAIH